MIGEKGEEALPADRWGEGSRDALAPPPPPPWPPSPVSAHLQQAQAVGWARSRASRVAAFAFQPWDEGKPPAPSGPSCLSFLCAQDSTRGAIGG